jgi:subtilisin family serine protease
MKVSFSLILSVMLALISCGTAPSQPFPVKKPKKRVGIPCTRKPIVVAIADTGFGATLFDLKIKLCKFGHRDFTSVQKFHPLADYATVDPVPSDDHGHGTHVAGIIDGILKQTNVNYCIVILKYYNPSSDSENNDNLENTIKAINYATSIHAKYFNYSGGGLSTRDEEKQAVKAFIDAGGKFVAAAGNERSDLAKKPYYPAMDDDRVIVVGNLYSNGETHNPTSNFGDRVNMWEKGTNVKVCVPGQCMYMTGTSQATAVATGKLASKEKNVCN